MFHAAGLILSLPALELSDWVVPGSFFGIDELREAAISPDLHLAVDLVAAEAARLAVPLRVVARPEIFTNGESLAWMQREVGSARDHLCISDGQAVRVLPGLRTHVFFYRPGQREGALALRRLARRAPELLATIQTQVNSAFALAPPGEATGNLPPTRILRRAAPPSPNAIRLLPLYLNPNSLEDSGGRMLLSPPLDIAAFGALRELTYIAISSLAWGSGDVAAAMAALLVKAYLDPTVGIIIRVPEMAAVTEPWHRSLQPVYDVLGALVASRVHLPRVPAANIALALGDLHGDHLDTLSRPPRMVIDEAFDAWRHDRAFYDRLQVIHLLTEEHRARALVSGAALLTEFLGRPPHTLAVPRLPDALF